TGAVQHVVTDHLGTPRELFDETGRLIFATEHYSWGAVRRQWVPAPGNTNAAPLGEGVPSSPRSFGALALVLAADPEPTPLCPIRFQGQWADEESGLHYNRYRYYDPLTGSYLSPDPIGVMGGLRPNGYVNEPTGWVDPLGLNALRQNLINAGQGLSVPWQAHHLIPCAVWRNHKGMFDAIGMKRDAASNGIPLPTNQADATTLNLPQHLGSHAAYNTRNELAVSAIEKSWRQQRRCAKSATERAAADRRARSALQLLQAENTQIIKNFGSAFPGSNMNACP
ncbi:RHS repeat-associated core domain-containing protein, partial [Tabrizicola sp.]|uniref:RHS repeat-associated core domain-containing protein n=1 Tax=Tabrizicola sp. TaxID=2005166 RepID=UPI003F35178C